MVKMQMNSLMNWKDVPKMSSYNAVITKATQRDLLDIFDYIAFELHEPDSASHLLSIIRTKGEILRDVLKQNNVISELKQETQIKR